MVLEMTTEVTGKKRTKVPFFRHSLGKPELAATERVLNGLFLTTGPETNAFEQEFAAYLGAQHAIAVSSWTAGAFLVLKAWGIGPDDEVIVPAMTFVATANIVEHAGARPVFVDVDPKTALIDLEGVKRAITARTKAIIPVHLYGQMVDMKELKEIVGDRPIKILEDAAHCIEGERAGIRPGRIGDAAGFSFYATKNMTCGEGGAMITDDPELDKTLRQIRLHGLSVSALTRHQKFSHWDMELLGYKANMSDLQSALLRCQLPKLEEWLKRREEICREYEAHLDRLGIGYPVILDGVKPARHLFTMWVSPEKRDEFLGRLQQKGVGVAVNYRAVHLTTYYRRKYGFKRGDFPVAEQIGDRTISLPLYPSLTDEELGYVKEAIEEIAKEIGV